MGIRKYSVTGSDTCTASTTGAGITGGTTVRPELYDMLLSSVATPADNSCEYFIQRSTAAGTSTGFTPVPLDTADPASTTVAGINHSVEPTYTANLVPLRVAVNQRNTFRFVARDGSEIRVPATSSNGLGLLFNAIGGSAVAVSFTLWFGE